MQSVLNLFNKVGATSSKKEKEAILARELPLSPLAQRVAKYALDQGKSYNLTELPEVGTNGSPANIEGIFACLDKLAAKRGATQEEAHELALCCHNMDTRELVTRIIRKDLDIGAKANTFNKAVPDLIYTVPYNRYSSFAKLKPDILQDESLLVQQKNDGFFAYMQDPELASKPFCTRQGNTFSLSGFIESDFHWLRPIQNYHKEPIRLEGELLVWDYSNKKFLPRAVGNGLLAEFYNGGDMPGFDDQIRYIIWGYVTESEWSARKSNRVYRKIWSNLKVAYNNSNATGYICLTQSREVPDYGAAMDFYREMRKSGHEGAMLKLPDQLCWKNNSSGNPHGFKMKAEAEAEFEIVDAYAGDPKGKWKDDLGGLIVKSSCGKILTRIGGGFTDDERKLGLAWWRSKKGKIITGKFTDIVKDKTGRETFCLEHSRLLNVGGAMVETRFSEKDTADDLAYCLDQLKTA